MCLLDNIILPDISDLDGKQSNSKCRGPANFMALVGKLLDYGYRPEEYTGFPKDIFKRVIEELSACGFYYRGMKPEEAKSILADLEPGSFLLRDSSQSLSNYFTLTYKDTFNQTRHIRIEYSKGSFSFSSRNKSTHFNVKGDTVLRLIQNYIEKSSGKRSPEAKKVKTENFDTNISQFTEKKSAKTETIKPYLVKPALKSVPSLQHLCRITINEKNCDSDKCVLRDYLKVYPYTL